MRFIAYINIRRQLRPITLVLVPGQLFSKKACVAPKPLRRFITPLQGFRSNLFEKVCDQAFFEKVCGQAFFEKACDYAGWF